MQGFKYDDQEKAYLSMRKCFIENEKKIGKKIIFLVRDCTDSR